MEISRGTAAGSPSAQMAETFTGQVWRDLILSPSADVNVANVFFAPGSRTDWHHHEHGQIIVVTTGSGFVGVRGEEAARVRAGDVIWSPPGEEHWHGADRDHYLVHLAITLGHTEWLDAVSDRELEG